MAVDVTVCEGTEEGALLLLVPYTAIDDEIDAVQDRLGEAGRGTGALLVAVIERRRDGWQWGQPARQEER